MNHRNEHEGTVMKEKNRKSENMESENRKTGNRKTELLGNAPIPKALLAMGLPTMIGMMINALYNLVEMCIRDREKPAEPQPVKKRHAPKAKTLQTA